jgi:hypothetical protein
MAKESGLCMLNYFPKIRRCCCSIVARKMRNEKMLKRKRKTKFTISNLSLSFSSFFPNNSSVSFKFGVVTMSAGIIGVPLGSYLSTKLSKRYPRSDPVICAMGLLISAPLIAASMLVVTWNSTLAYIFVFLGEVALNCNWSIVADMLLVRICTCKM